MEFDVNNGRKINLEQAEPDGSIHVTAWKAPDAEGNRDCDYELAISPGDFVMMLNWYQHQKRIGNDVLNF